MAVTAQPRRARRRNGGNDVPQPAAAKPAETAEQRAQREQREHWEQVVKEASAGENQSANRQVRRALTLEKQIAEVRQRINDNREYLRLMDRNDELSEAQSEFLDTFYPEKERGERRSAEEVEATRKAREFARDLDD